MLSKVRWFEELGLELFSGITFVSFEHLDISFRGSLVNHEIIKKTHVVSTSEPTGNGYRHIVPS